MSSNLFRSVEPMEMSNEIATDEAPPNARVGQYIGMQRKITVLLILTVVNITVTVALVSFIALNSMKNQTENARINAELESLKSWKNGPTIWKRLELFGLKSGIHIYGQQNTDTDLVKAIETKLNELEEHQKKEEIFIGVLKDRFGNELLKAVHPDIRKNISENFSNPKQNFWDVNASHSDLEIFGSESLKVHYKGDGSGCRSVFAKHPILFTESGIFYFEMKIRNSLLNWICHQSDAIRRKGGQNSDGCAYQSNGQFWANGSNNVGMPNYSHGDFVDCGINLATRRIIFTKNGQPLDTANFFLSLSSAGFPLFPFVSLNDSGDLIETNFGPQFKFDPAKVQIILNLPPQNYWDANFCNENLEIIGNKSLTVYHKGDDNDDSWLSVFAKYSILLNKPLSDFFNYEISVKNKKNWFISFGFAVKQQNKLDGTIRSHKGTYAYDSDGEIWINGEGKGINVEYSYGVGDTVGIGVNLATRQFFFTRNGQRLGCSDFFVASYFSDDSLHPFVSLAAINYQIEANFGSNFKFDLATL